MRILLSYAAEYDKGEGVHFERVLRRIGHSVVTVNDSAEAASTSSGSAPIAAFRAGTDLGRILSIVGGADLFLYIEPLALIPRGLEESPIPTACVISDVHRNLESRRTLSLLFDHVFLYQRNYLPCFNRHPRNAVHWLPWACDIEIFRDLGTPRDLDVAFIGQLFGPRSRRRRVIKKLASQGFRLNEQRYYLQREIPETYSRAKIVINLPIGRDLNCRVFEAMACGALLLTTHEQNGQEELFRENVDYVTFRDDAELLEKVAYFLSHEGERLRIAKSGNALVVERHNLAIRLGELLDRIRAGPSECAPVRQFEASQVLATYAKVYQQNGWIEALLKIAAEPKTDTLGRSLLLAQGARCFVRRAIRGW